MGHVQPAAISHATELVRPLRYLWIVREGTGNMSRSGASFSYICTLGFDPSFNKFVGSWIGSMMTRFFVDEGQWSQSQQADGSWVKFMSGTFVRMK